MSRYQILLNVLDKLAAEAPEEYKSYYPDPSNIEGINHKRSKALIHLFLKVQFGLITFKEREQHITDEAHDAGIDAYFIDKDSRIIYFIQSKFRTTETNFEQKNIDLEEILNMDIERLLAGECRYENGCEYNSKIKQMTKKIQVKRAGSGL